MFYFQLYFFLIYLFIFFVNVRESTNWISTMNLQLIQEYMNPSARQRFKNVLQELFWVPPQPDSEPTKQSEVQEQDLQALLQAGVIERVDKKGEKRFPTRQFIIPFSVVESDDEGRQRRRFIAWTKSDNTRLKGYSPEVPLWHPSKYLYRVHAEVGLKRDLRCGFYQVAVPVQARRKFRFTSAAGELFQMKVMPMGHRCTPEIMNTVTAVLAGDSRVCSATRSYGVGECYVYVDGIRFVGTDAEANKFASFVDTRCRVVGGAFKDVGKPPQKQYVFNGVRYDHGMHRVALGPKVVSKLATDQFHHPTFIDLEATVGCLIYCSSVVGIVIPKYHFALKIVQRRINLLNRCPWIGYKEVSLPIKTRAMLAEWRNEILNNVPIVPSPHPDMAPHQHRLYTDASAKGWGAILYLDQGEVLIAGGPWERGTEYEVNLYLVDFIFSTLTYPRHMTAYHERHCGKF